MIKTCDRKPYTYTTLTTRPSPPISNRHGARQPMKQTPQYSSDLLSGQITRREKRGGESRVGHRGSSASKADHPTISMVQRATYNMYLILFSFFSSHPLHLPYLSSPLPFVMLVWSDDRAGTSPSLPTTAYYDIPGYINSTTSYVRGDGEDVLLQHSIHAARFSTCNVPGTWVLSSLSQFSRRNVATARGSYTSMPFSTR